MGTCSRPRPLRVLVACEFSGRVRDAFIARGHRAVSCDLIPSERPGPHHIGDVRELLVPGRWDLMIAFPPCRYLATSGARWFAEREREQAAAVRFVRQLMRAPIPRIAIENPVGVLSSRIRRPDQIVHPWWFGHGETKATCLWLTNLPLLRPTRIVDGRMPRVWALGETKGRPRMRSLTYPGLASAMARQWGTLR